MENNKDIAGKEKTAVKAKTVTLKAKGKSLTGQPLDNIELNPQLDNDNKQVTEQSRGGVVLSFGRMNPPTVGHEKLVKKVVDVANSQRATPMIFLSHSQDKKKNPLEYADKVRFAKKAFGNLVQASPAKTLIDIAKNLQNKFKEMTIVVGSDRVREFEVLLNKYNGKEYNFDKITVVSAGERDPDAEGVEGMSASKMRAAAQGGDRQKFISGLPSSLKRHGAEVFALVSSGMKLHEELEAEGLLSEVLDMNQRRKRALVMRRYSAKIARAKELSRKRLAPNEKLKKRALVQARNIIRKRVAGKRGQEYHSLSPSERIQVDKMVEKRKSAIGKIAKRILPKVKAAEFARLKSFTFGGKLAQLHSGPTSQHEQFNQMFEQVVSQVEIVTVDSIIEEMTNLVLDKIITEKQIKSLEKRSERSGVDFNILEQVYVRGLLDSMGDQAIAFNRVNAFICGGKTAVNEDADLYAMVERKDLNDVFEGRAPGIAYVKPHIEKGQTKQSGWKASTKWGKVKYFGNDFKKAAQRHADIDEAFAQATARDTNTLTPKNDSLLRKKLPKVARNSIPSIDDNDAEAPTSSASSHFKLQQINKKIIDETASLDDLFSDAYTTADLEETAKSADKGPVVVPSHLDAYGNTIPAKTVMRRKNKAIVNVGDNQTDGK
tara:strand:- start:843 stop:2822 length:1980 start_codon:yes stop_codon:yes gene_type:complete